MLSRSRLSQLRALHQKKNRKEQQLFIAEGNKLVTELLASAVEVTGVYATENWLSTHAAEAAKAGETIPVSREDLSRLSSLVTPQDVLAVAKIPVYHPDFVQLAGKFTLVLDGIRDPGNLGTIIRIADWFGIYDIICSPDSAEAWNPKVIQSSMGSIIRVRIHEMEPGDFFTAMNAAAGEIPLPVYGTFLEGKSIYDTAFGTAGVVVIGNEANGIRNETGRFVTEKITIPGYAATDQTERPESLNAAVATGIICAEIRRR